MQETSLFNIYLGISVMTDDFILPTQSLEITNKVGYNICICAHRGDVVVYKCLHMSCVFKKI